MATGQQIHWIRSSKKEEEAMKEIQSIDPLLRPKENQIRSGFEFESVQKMTKSDQAKPEADTELLLKDILYPKYKNELGSIDFGTFGRISVEHGDILNQPDDSIIVLPMPPNLTPYRGLSLEALERGGDSLVRQMFSTARNLHSSQIIPVEGETDEVSATTRGRPEPPRGLSIGSVIPVGNKYFVIAPHYWQGNSSDANQRLRITVKSLIEYAIHEGEASRMVIPHVGRGQFGYDTTDWSYEAIVEEAIESLLQLDHRETVKTRPVDIVFIDKDLSVAEEFNAAIESLADRWLPERRVITAPQYWSRASRRMIVMDESSELQTMRRRDKYKFKQYHGKLRNLGGRYFRETLQPWIWRTQKVLEPPPMLVNEKTGNIADKQLPARPYYFRGLSHTLFPTSQLRTGFPSMRRSRSGQLMGVNRQPDTQKIAKPRS